MIGSCTRAAALRPLPAAAMTGFDGDFPGTISIAAEAPHG